ncbi:hypothetical protein BH10BDE1_BH10BDE1_24390 [soil metagenome]
MFEFYVRFIWPVHRRFVRQQIASRCRRCAASEKMLRIETDGLCEACHRYIAAGDGETANSALRRNENAAEQERLNRILESHENTPGASYDALVLFSGGKDSSYLIHRLKLEHPRLRILAYTINNGFMSPIALGNIDDLVGRMAIDHVFVRPSRKWYELLFGYGLTHLNEDGAYGTVDFSDGEFMLDTARRIAAEKKIPLILCGYSRYQVQNGLNLNSFESPRERERSDRTSVAGFALSSVFTPTEVQNWWHGSAWPEERVARLLFPLFVWDLEEDEIKRQVAAWGLLTKNDYSPAATNHQLIPLLGVVDVHRIGYSSFEPEFCRMIREGKADRKTWQFTFEFLEFTARTGLFIKRPVDDGLAWLNLTRTDVGITFEKD